MQKTKQPWSKFFWADWRADPKLRICSLSARGLWIEMLAIMNESVPRGYLLVNGLTPTDAQLGVMAGAPADQIADLVNELEQAGVFSRTQKHVIYSRRMTTDDKKAKTARKNGLTGGNPSLRKDKGNAAWDNPSVKTQKPEAIFHIPNERPNTSGVKNPNGAECDRLVERLVQAANGNVVNGASGIEVIRPILDLQAQGCDLERDIVPAIQAVVPKLEKPLRTWGARFLRDAILAKQAERLRGRGNATTKPVSDEEKWNAQLRAWKDGKGMWHQNWGPQPNAEGCRIPKEFLDRFNAANAAT